MRAMILAAGLGKRMQPLTNQTPKPLVELAGQPLIVYHLKNLARANIKDIVINLGHLGEKIESVLKDGSEFGVNIEYSREDPILETGGGVVKALPLLGPDPFLVLSGDILTDYPFQNLPKNLEKLAHFVLVDNPPHHPKGDYALSGDLVNQTGDPLLNYGGITVFDPKFFEGAPKGKFPLPVLFEKWMPKGEITGEYYSGLWHNLGTIEQLHALNESAIIHQFCRQLV